MNFIVTEIFSILGDFVTHRAHLIGKNMTSAPSALIPFCAFKSNLSMGKPILRHPNLSFPVCDSFEPDILEGQLCYTLKLKESSGMGKTNGLMLLLDLNKGRSIHIKRDLSPQSKVVVENKKEMNERRHASQFIGQNSPRLTLSL